MHGMARFAGVTIFYAIASRRCFGFGGDSIGRQRRLGVFGVIAALYFALFVPLPIENKQTFRFSNGLDMHSKLINVNGNVQTLLIIMNS